MSCLYFGCIWNLNDTQFFFRIADPDASKPEDWDEDAPEYITDDSASMPDGWLEDEDELTPDPDAERPADWWVFFFNSARW